MQETKEALCELVDGVLVEKAMGAYESALALPIAHFMLSHLRKDRLGWVLGSGGPVRTIVPQVRMPDVCFISYARAGSRKFPKSKVFPCSPDLAVEILSESNTRKEMDRKLREYFAAGTRLVWYIDPVKRTAQVYTGENAVVDLTEDGELDGGEVLPGFRLGLRDLFEDAGALEA